MRHQHAKLLGKHYRLSQVSHPVFIAKPRTLPESSLTVKRVSLRAIKVISHR